MLGSRAHEQETCFCNAGVPNLNAQCFVIYCQEGVCGAGSLMSMVTQSAHSNEALQCMQAEVE